MCPASSVCVHYPTFHIQLQLSGPPAASSSQCLPQACQGQERAFTFFLRLSSGLISQVGRRMQVGARISAIPPPPANSHSQLNCSPHPPHLTTLTHRHLTTLTLPFPPGPLPQCAYTVPPETAQRTCHL